VDDFILVALCLLVYFDPQVVLLKVKLIQVLLLRDVDLLSQPEIIIQERIVVVEDRQLGLHTCLPLERRFPSQLPLKTKRRHRRRLPHLKTRPLHRTPPIPLLLTHRQLEFRAEEARELLFREGGGVDADVWTLGGGEGGASVKVVFYLV